METLFGPKNRTDALVAIARLGRTYVSELARLLGLRGIEVQRAIASLERSGAIVTNKVGTTRIIELNPRYVAYDELYPLLLRLSESAGYQERWKSLRRRPRAMGKTE